MEEKEIFEKIRNGDEKVFQSLFERYYGLLCHYASHFLNDDDQSREVVQDLFVKIWEKRKTLNIEFSLRHYLFRSVRNQCLNLIQHEKVKKIHAGKLQEALMAENDAGNYYISQEMITQMEEGISSLPEKRREIFRLSREENLKYREIAEKLGISIKTVEVQMGLALKTLRETIRKTFIFFFFLKKKA